jgi:hypothetical protein
LCVKVEVDGFAVILYLVYGDEVVGELHSNLLFKMLVLVCDYKNSYYFYSNRLFL